MKKDIHPKYNSNAKVSCACGASFTVGSTQPEIKVDICSACHPFYTGEMKFIDTKGRIEKFQAKQTAAATYTRKKKEKTQKRETPRSLKEMLTQS
jgi:large subunit ribosomal protein L31